MPATARVWGAEGRHGNCVTLWLSNPLGRYEQCLRTYADALTLFLWQGALKPMTPLRLAALLCALSLLFPALALPLSDGCRQYLMLNDELRQLYARGDGMALRIAPVPELFRDLGSARVHDVAQRKLQASGLYDPDAPQWLEVNVYLDRDQFAIRMSLRRWAHDLGYGLPGESTVWGLGGDGRHGGSAGRVLTMVSQHMDEFIMLYVQAQRACDVAHADARLFVPLHAPNFLPCVGFGSVGRRAPEAAPGAGSRLRWR